MKFKHTASYVQKIKSCQITVNEWVTHWRGTNDTFTLHYGKSSRYIKREFTVATKKLKVEKELQQIKQKENQSTVSTAKRLASLFWYLIASTIDNLHYTINGYEIACIWNSKYYVHVHVHVCMIQTNVDFIIQKLIVFVSCWL